MSGPQLTAEQVAEQLARARKLLDHVPEELRPAAAKGLDALEEHADDLAVVGTLGAARALAWWSAVDPFSDPPRRPVGREAGLAAIRAAGDALQDQEDAERLALARLKRAAVDVGLVVLRAALPLLLAAL